MAAVKLSNHIVVEFSKRQRIEGTVTKIWLPLENS